MIILLRQTQTGLYLAPNGCWTTEKSEALHLQSVKHAIALMPAVQGPLELLYEFDGSSLHFTIPISFAIQPSAPPKPKPAPGQQGGMRPGT